jgi:hypothetical protein
LQHIVDLVQQQLPGIYVVNLEVTGSRLGSVFTGSNKQVRLERLASNKTRVHSHWLTH